MAFNLIELGVSQFIPIFSYTKGFDNLDLYKGVSIYLGVLLSAATIAAGYWCGRRADMVNHYKDYLSAMAYAWGLTLILSIVGWVLTGNILRTMFEVALINGITGYRILAPFFSGMTLGWLVEEKFTIRPVWSKGIMRYVLVFQGVILVQSLIRLYMSSQLLGKIHPAEYGYYSAAMSLIFIPVSLWFVWKCLRLVRSLN